MSEQTNYGYDHPAVEQYFKDTYMDNVYEGSQVALRAARLAADMRQRELERNGGEWDGAFERPDQMVWHEPELSEN